MPISVKNHNWNFQTPNPGTKTLLETAQWFCADIKTKQRSYWLTLLGNSGTGKTHIAKAICAWYAANASGESFLKDVNVIGRTDYRYRTWSKLMEQLYAGNHEGIADTISETLLVIDDFGSGHDPSKYGVSKLLEIMNRREHMWTVFTSNLTPGQIAENLDTRIASRLVRNNSKIIEMTCKDFNL